LHVGKRGEENDGSEEQNDAPSRHELDEPVGDERS
jgi:hypothetical protein